MTQLRHGIAGGGRTTRVGLRSLAAAVALSVGMVAMVAGAAPSRADEEPPAVKVWAPDPPETSEVGEEARISGRAAPWQLPPGLQDVGTWAKLDARRFSAPMPGNLAPFGPILDVADSSLETRDPAYSSGVAFESSSSVNSQCLKALGLGVRNTCVTTTHTVTFPEPVANPAFWVYQGLFSVFPQTNNNWTITGWGDLSITRVNGMAPRPGQIGAVELNDASFNAATNTMVTDDSVLRGRVPSPHGFLLVDGLVSSVTFSHTGYEAVTSNNGVATPVWTGPAGPRFQMISKVQVADLAITTTAPAEVPAGGTVTWTLDVRNNGGAASHGFTVRDAVPAGVTGARLVSGPPGCTLVGTDLQCAAAPTGWSVTRNGSVPTFSRLSGGDSAAEVQAVLAPGAAWTPIVLEATVTAPAGSTLSNTATVAGADIDPSTANNTSTATTRVVASWGITKTSSPATGTVLAPGSTVDYQVQATSTSGQIDGVVLTDDLSDVLDDATFVPGSARLSIDGGPAATVPDPTGTTLTTPAFTLPAGKTAVLTYQVTVKADAWSASLGNSVTGTGSIPPTTCAPGPHAAPVCSTTNPTFSHVFITKKGTTPTGDITELVGAQFTLHTDSNGTPGTLVDPGPVAVPGQTGTVEATNLTPGTYWLTETRAPAGHTLLADPIPFTIATDGTLALADPAAHPQVSVDGATLTVLDVPALTLPNAGGTGTNTALLAAGAALLLTALVALARTPAVRGSTSLRPRLRRPTRVNPPLS